jgi:hypothetical protein
VDAEWGKRAESLKLKAESRGQKTEFGMRNGEGGIKRRWGDLKAELGMRPPASPSCRLYPPGRSRLPLRDGVEPEAVGAIMACPLSEL